MNVNELTIPQLNHWVAKALGWEQRLWGAIPVWFDPNDEGRYRCHVSQWNPSECWAQGGLIIEREGIKLKYGMFEKWEANLKAPYYKFGMEGTTALIAAMRTFVASHFDVEVDDSQAD